MSRSVIPRRIAMFCLMIGLTVLPVWAAEESGVLTDAGLEFGFGLTTIYQRNVKGGHSTDTRSGEFVGSYDVELTADLQRLLGIDGTLFIHGEGGWSDSEGIDHASVASSFSVNADAIGNRSLDIVELFYSVGLSDGLTLTVGKIDFTRFFDASVYANDEAAQFLDGALVNNPAIPFPDYCLGLIASMELGETGFLAVGLGDAHADCRTTGFNTAFHDDPDYFYIAEAGVHTTSRDRPGAYRLGLWYDPRPKPEDEAVQHRDDIGFYSSCDQMISKENSNAEDAQGLGVFFRYGYADAGRNDIEHVYSFGAQCQGLIDGRDEDVLGIGFANGQFTDRVSAGFVEDHEGVIEAYYSIQLSEQVVLTPDFQYLINCGSEGSPHGDAVVLGLRSQINF